jgi:cysteinyl-tRNA synthetase
MTRGYGNILDQIGSTPLVPIKAVNSNPRVQILAKLECFNPGGSVKDRPALYMIEEAERKGELSRDKTILEATSGNTGIGLSLVAAVKGYRILLLMSESVSEERKKILRGMGADLKFTPAHMGTDGAIESVYELIREEPDRYWLADQFNNQANWMSHYRGTAAEIWDQTDGQVDAVVSSMGTTGTLMGLARRFKEMAPSVKIVGAEPYLGHRIQGLKNMTESYRPGIFEKNRVDRILLVDDEEAYDTARMLARKEGLFLGMSSGAAMAVALRLAKEMKEGRIVVIMPDGGERYLSTPLFVDREKSSGLFIYNTLSRKKEEFLPLNENRVTLCSCGPTLSKLIHLDECRRFVFADLVRRYLEFRGFEVIHIINVTDLDDRTIEGSDSAGMGLRDYTESFYQEFLKDLESLNIKKAEKFPRSSEHTDDMILLTRRLLEKGYAYEKFRSIYFDISRFKEYGKLSRIDLEKIRIGKTVDLDEYEKDNPRDFTLLKRSTLSELKRGIYYQTPWGNVRPSWHLQFPAMAMKECGENYDIHTSSANLIFPHHENAIAVSQAVTGKPLACYWLHSELVMINGKRLPCPSEANTCTLRDLMEQGYTGRDVRYWLISRHYRKPLYFSWSKLETARNTVDHLDQFIRKIFFISEGNPVPDMDQLIYSLKTKFVAAMNDDFNVALALAALYEFTGSINRIMGQGGLAPPDKHKVVDTLGSINAVLGFMDLEPGIQDDRVGEKVRKRDEARKDKDWDTADRIRRELRDMGIELIDTRDGTIWRYGKRPKNS